MRIGDAFSGCALWVRTRSVRASALDAYVLGVFSWGAYKRCVIGLLTQGALGIKGIFVEFIGRLIIGICRFTSGLNRLINVIHC